MGDRALIQFKDKEEFSPVLYTHRGGDKVLDVIRQTYEEVSKTGNSTECAVVFTTFVKNMYATGEGSFALYNHDGLLREGDSPGDFGCAIVDTNTGIYDSRRNPVWRVYVGGGYGDEQADGTFSLDEVPPLVIHGYRVVSPVPEEVVGRVRLLEKTANSMLSEMTQSINRYKATVADFKEQITKLLGE